MDDSFQTHLRREFSWFSYRLSHWTASAFIGAVILVPAIIAFVLLAALAVAWPVDIGNHYLGGTDTLDWTGWVLGIMNTVEAAMIERKGLLMISMLATGTVLLTMERHPLARIVASVGCIAVHLMLLGALI